MKTNFRTLFFSLLLLCSTAVSAHDFEVDGVYYNITDELMKTVEVTFSGSSYNSVSNEYTGAVDIPATVTYSGVTYSVTNVANSAFYACTGLTSVVIPEGVTNIGWDAFYACGNLASISIPNSVKYIDDAAFYGTAWYDDQPDGVVYAGKVLYAYKGTMSSSTSFTVATGTVAITANAFFGKTNLRSITIPASVQRIGHNAFLSTTWLNNQLDGVVYAGNVLYTYKGTMPANTTITVKDGTYGIADGAFTDCTNLVSITLSSSVRVIGADAFNGCTRLASITIPDEVTTIGNGAFSDCTSLTSVRLGYGVTHINNFAFSGCTAIETVYNNSLLNITRGSNAHGGVAYYASEVVEHEDYTFTTTNGVTTLAKYNGTRSKLVLPEYYKGQPYIIGNHAFSNNTNLSTVTIPNSVTSIGDYAFYNCTALYNVTIPNSVTSIGDYAFYVCESLRDIAIGSGVKSMGFNAFGYCENLANVRISDLSAWCGIDFCQFEGNPLYNASSLYVNGVAVTNLVIPADVTEIKKYAFEGFSGLTSVTIPSSVTTIGEEAFAYCANLATVYSMSATPATITGSTFPSSLSTLYVPTNSATAYQAADYWKNITNIVGNIEFNTFPAYFATEDGLPGTLEGDNYVWESETMQFETAKESIRLTVFGINTGGNYNGFPMVALGELEFYDGNGSKIDYTADDVTTNSLESTEGSLAGLCDGNYSTYYHSTWSSGTVPTGNVYVEVRFPRAVSALSVKIVGRDTKSLVPNKIGLTDGGVLCMAPTYGACGATATYNITDGVLTISGTGAVTSLPWATYKNSINSVVIEEGITSIPKDAFVNYANLTSATLPSTLTSLPQGAFSRTGLTSIELPEGLTSLGAWAFDNSPALATVSLPSTLTTMSNYVFENCSALKSITVLATTPAALGSDVFSGIDEAATLYVPKTAKAAYEANTGWNVIPNIEAILENYNITYYVDGQVFATAEVQEGSTIVPLEAPEKAHYEFIEWTGMPNVMPAEDITVEASYKQVSVSITISTYGAATYSSEFALDFSEVEGLKAYAATGYNRNTGAITLTNVQTTNAGVGLFVKGSPGTYTVPILDVSDDFSLNLFVATLQKTIVNERSDDGLYVNYKFTVAAGSTTPMFYTFTDGSSLSAGKSYLQLPVSWLPSNASNAISIVFDEGFVTDIDEVEANGTEGDGIYYDLGGRPVLNPTKGFYILNGKTVYVK